MKRHIDKELMQKYIDNECSKNEIIVIEKHLQECSKCKKQHEKQQEISSEIKNLLSGAVDENMEIPEFDSYINARPCVYTTTRPKNRKAAIWLLPVTAAACIILLLILILPKTSKRNDIEYNISIYTENYDANLPFSEQDYIITIEPWDNSYRHN